MFHFWIENHSKRSCHVRLLRKKMARVLSRQRRSIRREMTAQYTITEKHASKKLARVLPRQRRSIRRKTTAQYKMTAKPPYKKLARVPSRQRRSIRSEMPAQYKMSQKVASENWRESRPRKHRFRFLHRRYSTQNQKKCEKHEEISPQERNEDRWKKMNAKPAWQKWARVLSPHHMPR